MAAALEVGGWSAARPGRTLPPGKDPVLILQEAGWALISVCTGEKSRPHRDSIPDRPARSLSLHRLGYLAHTHIYVYIYMMRNIIFRIFIQKNSTPPPQPNNGHYCSYQVILFDIFIAIYDRILAQWKEVPCFSRAIAIERKT